MEIAKLLIDTNIYSDAMRGLDLAVGLLRRAVSVLMTPVILAELQCGFKGGLHEKKNLAQLDEFLSEPRVRLVPITEITSRFYALVYATLKKQGTPIPTNDIWIASCGLEHGAMLATRDSHFQKVPGLLLVIN